MIAKFIVQMFREHLLPSRLNAMHGGDHFMLSWCLSLCLCLAISFCLDVFPSLPPKGLLPKQAIFSVSIVSFTKYLSSVSYVLVIMLVERLTAGKLDVILRLKDLTSWQSHRRYVNEVPSAVGTYTEEMRPNLGNHERLFREEEMLNLWPNGLVRDKHILTAIKT